MQKFQWELIDENTKEVLKFVTMELIADALKDPRAMYSVCEQFGLPRSVFDYYIAIGNLH